MKPKPITLANKLFEWSKLSISERIDRSIASVCQKTDSDQSAYATAVQRNASYARTLLRSGRPEQYLTEAWYVRQKLLAKSIGQFSDKIQKCPRLVLDPKVTESVMKVKKTPIEKILPHFTQARPPFTDLWVEFCFRTIDVQDGVPTETDIDIQNGYLVSFKPETGISLRSIYIPNFDIPHSAPIGYFDDVTTITTNGVKNELCDFEAPEHTHFWRKRAAEDDAHIALCIFLLMNSRSKVIEANPASRVRGKLGYVEPLTTQAVKFDYSRIFKKYPNITREQAESLMNEQMVRGHFKVRPTGVAKGIHFWSPHIRNMLPNSTPEEAWNRQLSRPRDEVIRNPTTPLQTPFGIPVVEPD